MDLPPDRPPPASTAAAARHLVFGFGLREVGLGIVLLAALGAAGLWWQRRSSAQDRQWQTVRSELAMHADAAENYRARMAALQATANEIRIWAAAQTSEPLRTWAKERSKRFDEFVAGLGRDADVQRYQAAARKVEDAVRRGDAVVARRELAQMPWVNFPSADELAERRHHRFEAPLAQFSRRSPELYRALRQYEPDAATQDEKELRAEITAAGEAVTPQLMLKIDLLSAVAAPDDPVLTHWTALASAIDYFDRPDDETLGLWRRAQQALQRQDYQTAAAQMQSIIKSKARTRQPFRAAYGRTLLKCRPDQPADAYPFLVEAASAGDKQARTWVAQQDLQQGRYADAQRWLEAAAADGDAEATPLLITLYAEHPAELHTDPAHTIGVLERVTDNPDAPAASWLMLGRTYEAVDPTGEGKARAFACFVRAAQKGSAEGNLAVARCALTGRGTAENPDLARDAAARAFAGGEREPAAAIFLALFQRDPERSANAIERMFEDEQVVKGGGYMETRFVDGPGVTQLRAALARYFEQVGAFGRAAQMYAGLKNPAAERRQAELTAAHPCETCGGLGKVKQSVPCPTCGGKGKQLCGFCGGTGFIYIPGTPPCTTCGGSGVLVQDHRSVACAACGGTGKGKGNVVKQDCTHCEHGYNPCADCVGGMRTILKECPDCHGRGHWSWAERSTATVQ